MKKLFAVVLSVFFVAAVAVPALATDARQTALGAVGPYIEDDFNIFTWYGTLPSYSNTVWIGLNYYDYYYYLGAPAQPPMEEGFQPYMGASYGLGSEGKYGTLAMFFSYAGKPLNWMGEGWDYSGDTYSNFAYAKWNVMYGYAMEKFSFGLYFARSDDKDEYKWSNTYVAPIDTTEAYDELYSIAYTTIGAGVRFDIGEKMYADFAADYNWAGVNRKEPTPSYDYYYGGYGEVTADANKMMNFRGRAFYEYNETVTLVPYANFGTFDFSLKSDSNRVWNRPYTGADTLSWKDTNYGVKGMGIVFGIGANIKVNENNLLLFAVEPYSYYKVEQSDPPAADFVRQDRDYYPYGSDPWSWGRTEEMTATVLPTFRLALESDVKDWLTFRIGAVKGFYKDEEKVSYKSQFDTEGADDTREFAETDTYIGSYFDYWMGLGFHVGDFDIDAVVNNNLPFRVGYWLTGYSNNNDGPPVYMLSAAYHF